MIFVLFLDFPYHIRISIHTLFILIYVNKHREKQDYRRDEHMKLIVHKLVIVVNKRKLSCLPSVVWECEWDRFCLLKAFMSQLISAFTSDKKDGILFIQIFSDNRLVYVSFLGVKLDLIYLFILFIYYLFIYIYFFFGVEK